MLENIVLIADRDLIGVMIVHKERRDRHLQKMDREQHHEELEECKVSDKAMERFRRKPYSIKKEVTDHDRSYSDRSASCRHAVR